MSILFFLLSSIYDLFCFLQTGLEPLEYVLHPRMRAMQSLVQQLQDSVDCVYDVTVAYSNTFDPETNKRKESPTMQGMQIQL